MTNAPEPFEAQKSPSLTDRLGRPLRDLRISVTDRCNFRCVYCMPKQVFDRHFHFISHFDMLSFEEIARLARLAVAQGVTKIRLTGGEPLLRRHVENLVGLLSLIRQPDGSPIDLSLTTNGSVLVQKAQTLFDAGLRRITVSLDAIDDAIYRRMNDVNVGVDGVLAAIDTALAVGFSPVKVNAVIRRGINEDQVLPIVERFRHTPVIVRFIEFMDVGSSTRWDNTHVVSSRSLIEKIGAVHPIEPLERHYRAETAERWRYLDGAGEIGFISSVTHAFCHDCTRLRLSTDGRLFNCLFATDGFDIKTLLRSGADDETISRALAANWHGREDRYSELRGLARPAGTKKIEMSYIGG